MSLARSCEIWLQTLHEWFSTLRSSISLHDAVPGGRTSLLPILTQAWQDFVRACLEARRVSSL